MGNLDDYELDDRRDPETGMYNPEPEPQRGFRIALIAAAVLLAAGITAVYLYFKRPVPKAAPTPPPTAAAVPTPAATPAIALPPLDASDDLVRDLAKTFSNHPGFGPWLGVKNLVRTFVVVVGNVVDGENPASHVLFLAPRPPFLVRDAKGRTVVDPRSYGRLDGLADVVASFDAQECARVFGLVEPLTDAAYRELGHPEGRFREALGKAIQSLLDVPLLEGDVPVKRVVRAIVVYEYADPKLEALSPAQKALLRMGPRNVPRVQAKLRELAAALRSPAERTE
jgi:Protein of unknown function (DUF3014)